MRRTWDPERRYVWAAGLVTLVALAARVAWSQRGTVQATPPLVSASQAKTRGCRDDPTHLSRILPEWVSVQPADAPMIAEGVVRESHVAFEDTPNAHLSHDQNFVVALDPAYNGLNSDGNDVVDNERRMEMEWETKFFPTSFWPSPGDRFWMMGRWIFDCGHPEAYHSELHPALAVAFTRLQPTTFTGDTSPTLTNQCSIYIHGHGGYTDAPVAVRNYEFDMPVPPRPGLFSSLRTEVTALPFGGPRPILSFPGAAPNTLHVLYPLALNNPSPDLRFGAVIAAGWQGTVRPITTTFRVLRVTLDSIKINNDHDPDFPFITNHGEWHLFVRAGSQWMEVTGLGNVAGGDTVAINKSVQLTVPDSGEIPVSIQTTGWEDDCDGQFGPTIRSPSLSDLNCAINGNDHIGILAHDFTKAENFGIGSHDSLSTQNGDSDTLGDFNLRYHIDQIAVINPPPVNKL